MHNSDATWPPAQQPISLTKWCDVTTHNATQQPWPPAQQPICFTKLCHVTTHNATQQPWPPAQQPICFTKWCDVTTHNARRVLFQRSFRASKSCLCAVLWVYIRFSGAIMVDRVVKIFHEYEERLRSSDNVPRFSYGRRMMRDDGDPNRYFLMYLFCEQSMGIQFLKDIGLLRSKMQCNTCGRDMTWSADRNITESFRWRCHRSVARNRCNQSVSIKFGSWFQQSNLFSTSYPQFRQYTNHLKVRF